MNIALSSILLILLLVPSIFFRAAIIKSDSLENPLDTSIKTELGIVFIIGLIQHVLGICFVNILTPFRFDITLLFQYILGDSEFIDYNSLRISFFPFLIYTLAQTAIGIAIALILKKIILNYYWDIRSNYLPISNEWDQLLSGRLFEYDRLLKINDEINDLKEKQKLAARTIKARQNLNAVEKVRILKQLNKDVKKGINLLKNERKTPEYNFVEIDALVNTSEGDFIYKDRIFKYYLAKDNSLDKIILKDAFRRKFNDRTSEFHEFDSKLLVLKYSEIKNLNVRFTFFEEA